MFKIYPEIEFTANCLKDSSKLEIKKIVIPGMRCLAKANCPTCQTKFYIDLPVGGAIWYPTILEEETAKIYDLHNIKWFSQRLKDSFLNPVKTETVPQVHHFFDADRIIIVNCLDFLYGHSLLKLLNVQRYLDHHPELGCCVLVPTQLLHLVPDGVAEIWEFPVPIKEGWQWYSSLENWIQEQIKQRKECFLSRAYSHPSHRIYDLQLFVRDLPDISKEIQSYTPIILFSYREDRPWGRGLAHQQRNLQKLYNRLSVVFPEMVFILVGFGQKNQIRGNKAKVIDLRTNTFDVDQDRLWMAYMKVADCVVGVHGSNMLLPSGLGKTTVELIPKSRLGNIIQDLLFPHYLSDVREAFLKYRFLYGHDNLSDISSALVADVIINLIAYNEYCALWFKQGESEVSDSMPLSNKNSQLAEQFINHPIILVNFWHKIKAKIDALFREVLHFWDTLL